MVACIDGQTVISMYVDSRKYEGGGGGGIRYGMYVGLISFNLLYDYNIHY